MPKTRANKKSRSKSKTPKSLKGLEPEIVKAVIAEASVCTWRRGENSCALAALPGTRRCRRHAQKYGMLKAGGIYNVSLQDAPRYSEIVAALRRADPPSLRDMTEDLIQMRALTALFLEKQAKIIESGQPGFISAAQLMIENVTKLIERMEGKKYTVTVGGVNVIIEQVVAIVALHLESQPDVLKQISTDLSQLKLPAGSLARPGGTV